MLDDARAYTSKVHWQFARTTPRSPHWYTVRERRPDLLEDFLAFVVRIRRDGVIKPYRSPPAKPTYHHTYVEIDDWKYWTMGAPVLITTVIDRARPDDAVLALEPSVAGVAQRREASDRINDPVVAVP
jgi:hypothetical protein